MSCMPAYPMPLCTIFTKCPAPSGPTCVVHGTPSLFAAIASSIGPRACHGPLSAPSSPPDTPMRTK